MNISILLVDDDKLLVNKLEESIEWNKLGITTVLTAYNIRQAIRILEEAPADIILSDIEMPQGSGLELLEWVREKEIQTECIFLSSYAYFAYAQKAINLKSREYLLKPVSNRELEEKLANLVQYIKKNRQTGGNGNDNKASFWEKFIFQESISQTVVEKAEKSYVYKPKEQIRLQIIKAFPGAAARNKKDLSLHHFIVQNIASEYFQREGIQESLEAILRQSDYEWLLILRGNRLTDVTENTLNQFREYLIQALHMNVCFYIGNLCTMETSRESHKILEQMEQEAVPGEDGLLYEQQWKKRDISYIVPPWESWEKEMASSEMIEETMKKILLFIHRLWEDNQITISILERFRRELMQTIYRYLNKQDILITRIFDGKEFDEYYEKAAANLPDMEEFIKYMFEKLAGFKHQDNRQESVTEQMKQYINDHLKEELSRKILAETVYLSEDYVSKIFMNVTGVSIPGYIASRRINKAREYLKYTSLTVSQVALEVGYSNFSYFSKTFRDYIGCTPNEYRSRVKRKEP